MGQNTGTAAASPTGLIESTPYPRQLRIIHWVLIALVCAQIGAALLLTQLESAAIRHAMMEIRTQIESFLLLVVLFRFALGRRVKPPRTEGRQARATHGLHGAILLSLAILPVIGIAATWSRGGDLHILAVLDIPSFIEPSASRAATLEQWHALLGYSFLALLAVHIGAILFFRLVRKRPALHRMFPPPPAGKLVNRVPLVGQFCLCFGVMLALIVGAGMYGAYMYRMTNEIRVEFDRTDVTMFENMRAVQTTLATISSSAPTARLDSTSTQAMARLQQAAAQLSDQKVRDSLGSAVSAIRARIAGDQSPRQLELAKASLADAVHAQATVLAYKRQAISEAVAAGSDMMLLTIAVAVNLCLVMAYLLSRSILAGLSAARRMTKSIEEDSQACTIEVHGNGEFAMLMREMVRMRDAVASRLNDSHRSQAEISRQAMEREAQINGRNAAEQAHIVQQVADALSALAAGRLGYRISQAFPGEYDRIRTDFNQMIARLEQAMETISQSSEAIGNGSQNVAQEANSLAMRSRRQTSTLSEMAMALDRMTCEVRAAADGALKGAEAVSSVRTAAEDSGKIVGNAIQAMDDIEKSSVRIVEIIGVIDTFASRSNLLALNARIEAARAGESGRGFAVVAQEVHGLARRAGEAAREIRTLIAESNRHVGTGVALVQETGRVLQRIVGEVGQVDKLVAGVATSARDQAVRLTHVNSEMRQLDRIAHENTAMVGETTAALQSIRDNAATLDQMIKRLVHSDEVREASPPTNVVPISRKAASI